jgi:hypothetical protein
VKLKNQRSLLAGAFAITLACGYVAVSDDGKAPEEKLYGPSRDPDRIILTWDGDPATTQTVTWRTDASVGKPVAQIAESGDGPDFTKAARKVPVVSQTLDAELGTAQYHTAQFSGLEPKTLYSYRVGDGGHWSEWNQFRTASDRPDPLTFLYVGDAQNDIYSMWSRLIRMGFTEAPRTNFILHAGDLVNHGSSDVEWGEWLRAAGWINRSIPSLAVPGNHEYSKTLTGGRALTEYWRPQFGLPLNGLAGLEESCYYVDIQGVRIVALNSNERREEQAEWLDGLLANNPNRWTILTFHHPVFSSAKGRDNKELREAWQPVIDKHKVDLVLQGHDHTYARSNLVSGVNAKSGDHGTVYVVSVSGPKMYEVELNPVMARVAERTQLFQVIRVDGDSLEYEARTARGILYDAFELRKSDGEPNQLINRIPPVPQRVEVSGD